MRYIYKYAALVLAFIFVAIIKSSPLEEQMAFILAMLIICAIIYMVAQRKKTSYNMLFSGSKAEIFFISTIVLLMIEITGGAESPIYFLNYFLLFGLPLISTPLMSMIFTASIFTFNIPEIIRGFNTELIIRLGSLLLLLPLAYFLSNELMKRKRENKNIKEKIKHIEEEAESIEANNPDIQTRKELDEIIDSAEEIEEKL